MTKIALPGGGVRVPSMLSSAVRYSATFNHARRVDKNTVAVKRYDALIQARPSRTGNAGAALEMFRQRGRLYKALGASLGTIWAHDGFGEMSR